MDSTCLSKSRDLSPVEDIKRDSAWSLGPLKLNRSDLKTKISELGKKNIVMCTSCGNVHSPECAPKSALDISTELCELLLNRELSTMFQETEIETRMKSIIRDFVQARHGRVAFKESFEFKGYPLIVSKGGMAEDCVEAYKSVNVKTEEIFPRAVRDFFTSSYIFFHSRGFKLADLLICGSAICLTSMVDYCGASDDSNTGDESAYKLGMSEGLYKLLSRGYYSRLEELIITSAFMVHKNDCLKSATEEFANNKHWEWERSEKSITPEIYSQVRWWDAAMTPYFKLTFALGQGAGLKVDHEFTPTESSTCSNFRKCLDSALRYNELIDVNHDIKSFEPFNEVHIAARYGGLKAVKGYADECAAITDDTAICPCPIGDYAHDYALDLTIAASVWMIMAPRYRGFSQLAEVWDVTNEKYFQLIEQSRHGAWITTEFAVTERNDGVIHGEKWEPLWRMDGLPPYKEGPCDHCSLITKWILNRCVYREYREDKKHRIEKLVRSKLHDSKEKEMSKFWEDVFNIITEDVLFTNPATKDNLFAVFMMVLNLLKAVERKEVSPREAAKLPWSINIAADQALIAAFVEKEGYIAQRCVIGALSCILERTYFAVYKRILDAAIKHAQQ